MAIQESTVVGMSVEIPTVYIARRLFNRIDREGAYAALLLMYAIQNLAKANPMMTLADLTRMIEAEMPKSSQAYRDYLSHT